MWRIRCSVCQARNMRPVVSRRLRGRRGSGRLALAVEGELRHGASTSTALYAPAARGCSLILPGRASSESQTGRPGLSCQCPGALRRRRGLRACLGGDARTGFPAWSRLEHALTPAWSGRGHRPPTLCARWRVLKPPPAGVLLERHWHPKAASGPGTVCTHVPGRNNTFAKKKNVVSQCVD